MTDEPATAVPHVVDPESGLSLDEIRSGGARAFETLVRVHGPRVLAVTRTILKNEEDARDAVQDAFLSAFKAIGSFDGNARFSTWMHRIAVNAALMRLRKKRSIQEVTVEESLPEFQENGHRHDPAGPWRLLPDAAMEVEETRELVRRKIASLPEIYRDVLLLRDIQEKDTAETARELGITEPMVKTRLHRARQALRGLLEPHFRGKRP
jgi:RNA polymerase sigma-70 factor (ECF subfamily)